MKFIYIYAVILKDYLQLLIMVDIQKSTKMPNNFKSLIEHGIHNFYLRKRTEEDASHIP